MATDKVVSIKAKSNDAKDWTVRDMLVDAIKEIDSGARQDKKALILWLEDDANYYHVGFHQSGMTVPECILLCEMGKDRFKSIIFDD